jgi:hypothetical protein
MLFNFLLTYSSNYITRTSDPVNGNCTSITLLTSGPLANNLKIEGYGKALSTVYAPWIAVLEFSPVE